MRKFYFYGTIVVAVFILILSFAELGSSCSFTLLNSSSVTLTLLQMAGMGAIFGGLAVLFWKMPPPEDDDTEEFPEKKDEKISTKIDE